MLIFQRVLFLLILKRYFSERIWSLRRVSYWRIIPVTFSRRSPLVEPSVRAGQLRWCPQLTSSLDPYLEVELSLTVHLPVQLPVQYARSQFQPPTKGRITGKAMKSLKETILKRDFGSPFENSSRATRIFESLSDYQHVHKVSIFSMNKRIPFFSSLFFLIIEKGLTFYGISR